VFSRASQEVEDLEEIPSVAPRRPVSDRLGGHRRGGAGPYDVDEPDAERIRGGLDFGSLRVPMPARAQLQIEHGSGELLRAVHVLVPSGRVSLSALAAPRSTPLWRNLADEIAESLANDGARVWAEWGVWGREVLAASKGALSRFIGVDGPRWMLYGVATGPADGAESLADTLRQMIRGTVVTRGPDPLPVKTVLPLRLPEHLEERVERAREQAARRPEATDTAMPVTPVVPVTPTGVPDRSAGLAAGSGGSGSAGLAASAGQAASAGLAGSAGLAAGLGSAGLAAGSGSRSAGLAAAGSAGLAAGGPTGVRHRTHPSAPRRLPPGAPGLAPTSRPNGPSRPTGPTGVSGPTGPSQGAGPSRPTGPSQAAGPEGGPSAARPPLARPAAAGPAAGYRASGSSGTVSRSIGIRAVAPPSGPSRPANGTGPATGHSPSRAEGTGPVRYPEPSAGQPPRTTPPPAGTAAPPARRGLPPVTSLDTNGFPVGSVESTWSLARPVVSADQVAQQPAWALLSDAPAFWPGRYARVPEAPNRGALDDGRAQPHRGPTPPNRQVQPPAAGSWNNQPQDPRHGGYPVPDAGQPSYPDPARPSYPVAGRPSYSRLDPAQPGATHQDANYSGAHYSAANYSSPNQPAPNHSGPSYSGAYAGVNQPSANAPRTDYPTPAYPPADYATPSSSSPNQPIPNGSQPNFSSPNHSGQDYSSPNHSGSNYPNYSGSNYPPANYSSTDNSRSNYSSPNYSSPNYSSPNTPGPAQGVTPVQAAGWPRQPGELDPSSTQDRLAEVERQGRHRRE